MAMHLRRISFVLCIFVFQRFLSCRRLEVVGVQGDALGSENGLLDTEAS
jgi:hypothetical protein